MSRFQNGKELAMSDPGTNRKPASDPQKSRMPMIAIAVVVVLAVILIVYWLSADTGMVDNPQSDSTQIDDQNTPVDDTGTGTPTAPETTTTGD